MTTEWKRRRLIQLARRRQADRLPPHLCLADFHGGYYECDYVSPWTISACEIDAEVMIIGQDWASSEILEREPDPIRRSLGQDPWRRSNVNLGLFLECMGLKFSQTYATNLFPFIKRGAMKAPIDPRHLELCARTYALPQIEIVSPRMAIFLGKETFAAARRAAGLPPMEWTEARKASPHTRIGPVEVYGLPHPGEQGTNNAGGKEVVKGLWTHLGTNLRIRADGGAQVRLRK